MSGPPGPVATPPLSVPILGVTSVPGVVAPRVRTDSPPRVPPYKVGDSSIPAYRQRVAHGLIKPTDGRRRKRASALGLFAPSGSKLMKLALADAPASPTEAISPSKITLKGLLGGPLSHLAPL
jgi:hypothetical protein